MAKVLLLGGTAEAADLAARLAADPRLATVTSLAGLTRLPGPVAGAVRRGGFGGPEGLAAAIVQEGYDALIDATHPFAAQIARHAREAAERAGIPRVKLVRPAFRREPADHFIPVANMREAADALPQGARVFLAAGRRELAPFAARRDLWCLVRMIEPPSAGDILPDGELILGRPPRDPADEIALFRQHRIGWVLSKDSGGQAGAKIVAARALGLPVVLIERPLMPDGPTVPDVAGAIAWLNETLLARGIF